MLYMVTFTIHIPQMLAYIPYMDPMGYLIGYIVSGLQATYELTPYPKQEPFSGRSAFSGKIPT
jgi:hypothetical protein